MDVFEAKIANFADNTQGSILRDIPYFLRRQPLDVIPRKRRRRRGKRGRVVIRLKIHLRAGLPLSFTQDLSRFAVWHSPVLSSRCLTSIRADHPAPPDSPARLTQDSVSRIVIWPRPEGVNTANLHLLSKAPASCSTLTLRSPKMALINVHSLVNKTFILNDFISSHSLDFLFITETWVKVGDLSPYSELVPTDYCFYNSPHPVGRGGELAIITKKNFSFRCQTLPSTTFMSFEVQLLLLDWSDPIVLALIYRPLHLIKGFIAEFTEFIGDLITNYDWLPLLGDFNVHVCCPSKQLTPEFLNIIDSFNLRQWVTHPTHT